MVFSSIVFLFFFLPCVLILYYLAYFSRGLKNIILLLSSLFFYWWGEPRFVIMMILSIIVNYIFGLLVDKYRDVHNKGKIFLIMACIYNLGILFIFKYLTFILKNFNMNMESKIPIPNIVLPIGISFFTFQALSYVIDVYRGDAKVQKNPLNIGLYIALFPQLVAGPIVRYNSIEEQINGRNETWDKFSVGTCRFIVGLAKKILISNSVAIIAQKAFTMNAINPIAVTYAWLGAVAYTLQIYFDFSGYSDMAIGLGLMFGFKFEENFNYPYISKSVSEFWRRWHISLGNWFKDYVYFPMGGSRVKNKDKVIKNLLVVWVLTGVWHGAEWTFLIWGMWHFLFIAIEKLTNFHKKPGKPILKNIYVLLVVIIGWVIFGAKDIKEAGNYLSSMFGINGNILWGSETIMFLREYWMFILSAVIFSTPIARKINKNLAQGAPFSGILNFMYPITIGAVFLICVTYLIKGGYNPFIYFNF